MEVLLKCGEAEGVTPESLALLNHPREKQEAFIQMSYLRLISHCVKILFVTSIRNDELPSFG